jgi:hypothetical protein
MTQSCPCSSNSSCLLIVSKSSALLRAFARRTPGESLPARLLPRGTADFFFTALGFVLREVFVALGGLCRLMILHRMEGLGRVLRLGPPRHQAIGIEIPLRFSGSAGGIHPAAVPDHRHSFHARLSYQTIIGASEHLLVLTFWRFQRLYGMDG